MHFPTSIASPFKRIARVFFVINHQSKSVKVNNDVGFASIDKRIIWVKNVFVVFCGGIQFTIYLSQKPLHDHAAGRRCSVTSRQLHLRRLDT